MKLSSKITLAAVGTLLMVTFNNCSNVSFTPIDTASDGLGTPIVPPTDLPPVDVPPSAQPNPVTYKMTVTPSQGFVCSPFGSTIVPSDKSGLKAELRYIPSNSTLATGDKNSFASVEYFNDANTAFEKAAQTVYFQDVNVPTRKFSSGFANSDGALLKDSAGNVLVEYFALKMESILKLSATDAEGFYELATVSDDGTVVEINENGVWTKLIANDGAHSTKMGCGNRKIFFSKTTRLPIRIYYNQGPRTEIANVLMWNYRGPGVDSSAELSSDADVKMHCGRADSSKFWNPNSSSAAGEYYNYLVSKKWKIIPSANYQLPDNEVNPCSFNNYDLAPELTSADQKNFDLKLKESAALQVNVYKVNADASKTLMQSVSKQEDVRHNFEVTVFDVNNVYKIEIIATIENKKLKVLTDYTVKFTKE